MRHALLLLAILSVAVPDAPAKKKYEWQSGQVLAIVQEHLKVGSGSAERGSSPGMSSGFIMPEIRESLDIEGDATIYTVERIVFYRSALRLDQGEPVRFAIDGRTFILRTRGKEYRFKSFRSSPKKRLVP